MLTHPEPACLVIADISGYTGYLAGSELDHAQDILADLMNTVVGALRGRFRLAKLEGDAAFVFVPTERIDGSALLDALERTYLRFRRRLRDVRQATSCECNACRTIPSLDLKLVAHHGSIVRQRVAGREELVGADVIVVHRLLKNSVPERLGSHAYLLLSQGCIDAMGVDPITLGLREHRETYEHIGEVTCWVADLHATWQHDQAATVVQLAEDASLLIHQRLPVDPATTWDYLTSPTLRPRWQSGVQGVIEETGSGRRGVGTTNHCVHGADAVIEEVMDWRPYDYFTVRSLLPVPGAPKLLTTVLLHEDDGGTIITYRLERPKGAKAALMPLAEGYVTAVNSSFERLREQLAADALVGGADEGHGTGRG